MRCRLWLVKTGILSPVNYEFLIIADRKYNARLNAENWLMQHGDTHWAQSMVCPATIEDCQRLLGEDLGNYILGQKTV